MYFCEVNKDLVIDLITLSNKLFLFRLLKTLNDSDSVCKNYEVFI